jgi:sigma-B regulation protein RsbU (phosphoserine phosphatase)
MLRLVYAAYPHVFAELARAWLELGAESVSLWAGDECISGWPTIEAGTTWNLSVDLPLALHEPGRLRVGGLPDAPQFHARLSSDALLVAQIARLEDENEQLGATLIESQEQLLALYSLNRATGSSLQVSETLRLLAIETARLLHGEAAFVGLTAQRSSGIQTYQSDGSPGTFLEAEMWALFQYDNTERVLHAAETPEFVRLGIRDMLVMPVQVRGAVIAGVLGIINRQHPQFSAPDQKLARAIVDHASTVVERSIFYQDQLSQMRFQTEMDLARDVQARLLPQKLPWSATLDLFGRAQPAQRVGGDFYDMLVLPEGNILFTLGDVTGKGLAAALLMTMARSSLRGKARFTRDVSPLAIINRANEDLYDDMTDVEMFATIFVCTYNEPSRMLTYANAGHSPVIYRPVGGSARLLEPNGVPIGILPVNFCEEATLRLGPGDILVISTDGFNESRNRAGEMLGIQRMIELIDASAHLSAEALGRALFDQTDRFSGRQAPEDDRTLVVIKGKPCDA